ncbi:MAG: putative membrane protein YhhN [Paraglaciecola sp.]|jgi:uncharacterized membrane protein YhhN
MIFRLFSNMLHNAKCIYWFLALSYLLTLSISPYQYSFIHKALPITILLIVALQRLRRHTRIFITSALFFSAIGDMMLALTLEQGFIYGLAAFALAHMCYTACFYRWHRWHRRHLIKLTVLVIYVLFMLLLLLPVTGTLQVPLLIYLLLMSAMAYSAMVVNTANYHILLGAALFVLSDSLLATHKFLFLLPYEGLLVMGSYYSAQYFLLEGCIIKQDSHALT